MKCLPGGCLPLTVSNANLSLVDSSTLGSSEQRARQYPLESILSLPFVPFTPVFPSADSRWLYIATKAEKCDFAI
eukprot:COSAG01_NODE_23928_length_796_cov_15.635581_1_plen_74_part_10